MNFFDAYDVPGTTTPPTTSQPQQSLNDEVTQVVGQLSRFWGGFRKQSQTAFESARKDLGSVVEQAQKELTKLTAEVPQSPSSAPEPNTSANEQAASLPAVAEPSSSTPSTSADPHDASDEAAPETTASQSFQPQTLFSRLQASLPPSLVNTVQTQLPESLKETLKHARVGSAQLTALDFAQLRTTITSELQRVQGATEEYVHRSEEFLREAGEFLKDAVKVVPPEEGDSVYSGLIWDGTDVWMLPTTRSSETTVGDSSYAKGKGKERDVTPAVGRQSVDTLRAVATRAESMLKQLRHDPEVIRADPKDDENVREMYASWLATEAASEDRGMGTTAWLNRVERALADPVDGTALKGTMNALVPEPLTSDEFWTRYFFRVHQVESEEARRKAIIQGTSGIEAEDDFSWEDDDEDTTTTTIEKPPHAQTKQTTSATSAPDRTHLAPSVADSKSRTSTPSNLSPRQSSEDSYDVVSSQASNVGAADTDTIKAKKSEESSEDEDEEDDDDEEEDEEEEEEDEEEEGGDKEGGEEEGEEEEEEEDSDWE